MPVLIPKKLSEFNIVLRFNLPEIKAVYHGH